MTRKSPAAFCFWEFANCFVNVNFAPEISGGILSFLDSQSLIFFFFREHKCTRNKVVLSLQFSIRRVQRIPFFSFFYAVCFHFIFLKYFSMNMSFSFRSDKLREDTLCKKSFPLFHSFKKNNRSNRREHFSIVDIARSSNKPALYLLLLFFYILRDMACRNCRSTKEHFYSLEMARSKQNVFLVPLSRPN